MFVCLFVTSVITSEHFVPFVLLSATQINIIVYLSLKLSAKSYFHMQGDAVRGGDLLYVYVY